MKKLIAFTLAAALLFAFAGCAKSPEDPKASDEPTPSLPPEDPEEPLVGGFTWNTEFENPVIPEDALSVFDKAMEGYVGAKLTPVALLATQVVAGLNYEFLCTLTTVTANPAPATLAIAKIYGKLDGTAEVTEVFKLDEIPEGEEQVDFRAALPGGWTINTDGGAPLPERAQNAFDKAFEGFTGAKYTPVALLASQVVAGTNYKILCVGTTVTAEPETGLATVTVYADLNGGGEILEIRNFNYIIETQPTAE